MEVDLSTALTILRYSPQWLEFGLIDQSFFVKQFDEYQNAEDKNTEHYRYAAFQKILRTQTSLTDRSLNNYIKLALMDENQAMAKAALVDLIKWSELSDRQLEQLRHHPAILERGLQKLITRTTLLRQLKSEPLTDELFAHLLSGKDSVIHQRLLDLTEPGSERLKQLEINGANRSIRNQAQQKLQKRIK
jgi:hypothetical protein